MTLWTWSDGRTFPASRHDSMFPSVTIPRIALGERGGRVRAGTCPHRLPRICRHGQGAVLAKALPSLPVQRGQTVTQRAPGSLHRTLPRVASNGVLGRGTGTVPGGAGLQGPWAMPSRQTAPQGKASCCHPPAVLTLRAGARDTSAKTQGDDAARPPPRPLLRDTMHNGWSRALGTSVQSGPGRLASCGAHTSGWD